MKPQIVLYSLVTAVSLSSCGISSILGAESNTDRIERGMSREEVQHILGRPESRSLGYDGEEIWVYRSNDLFDTGRITEITFYRGRVARMNTYRAGERRREDSYPSYPSCPERGDYPRYEDSRRCMSDNAFQRFIYDVQRQSFKDDKLRYIYDAAQRNYFTVQQAERLLRLFSWDDEKLQVLQAVAPRLVNAYESYRLVELFTFDSGKRKARRILGFR